MSILFKQMDLVEFLKKVIDFALKSLQIHSRAKKTKQKSQMMPVKSR